MTDAEEVVRQVLRGEYACPSNTLPMHREVTSNPATARAAARDIVAALEAEGLLARCSCPVGFGNVAADGCVLHERRDPAHTISGPWRR